MVLKEKLRGAVTGRGGRRSMVDRLLEADARVLEGAQRCAAGAGDRGAVRH